MSSGHAASGRVRFAFVVAMFVVYGWLTGCGSSGPFQFVKATGKVTYEDGTKIPAHDLKLTFSPENPPIVNAKTVAPQGHADVTSADGSFDTITSGRPVRQWLDPRQAQSFGDSLQ